MLDSLFCGFIFDIDCWSNWFQKRTPDFGQNDFMSFFWRFFVDFVCAHFPHTFLGVPRLHFGVILASFWGPKAPFWGHFGSLFAPLKAQIWSHVVPMFALLVSDRFMIFSNITLRPPRQKLPKSFYPYVSHKNFQITQGAAVSRSVLDKKIRASMATFLR